MYLKPNSSIWYLAKRVSPYAIASVIGPLCVLINLPIYLYLNSDMGKFTGFDP